VEDRLVEWVNTGLEAGLREEKVWSALRKEDIIRGEKGVLIAKNR
jgi:hypothetical protein